MAKPLAELARNAREELGKAIVGYSDALDTLFLTLVCGGHALLEGVPGLGKTLAVRTLARILSVRFRRVQGTPDLMPADIIGANVFSMSSGQFTLHEGPVFTDLLLVDEVNRMPPRTQAALLEAMEERQVTIDGVPRPLSPLFTVIATQNPLEFEGTYPLPEAELDRFAVKITIGYPEAADEETILARHHDAIEMLLPSEVDRGASPRAAIHLMQIAKAIAAIEGRDYLLPDDVKRVAPPVLRHRLIIRPEADLEGVTSDQVIADVLASVPVPK